MNLLRTFCRPSTDIGQEPQCFLKYLVNHQNRSTCGNSEAAGYGRAAKLAWARTCTTESTEKLAVTAKHEEDWAVAVLCVEDHNAAIREGREAADVAEFGKIESMPRLEGRQMVMMIGPK